MDGVSLWKSITELSPSPRSEIVYNLDNKTIPEEGHAAIRFVRIKVVLRFALLRFILCICVDKNN